VRCWEATRDGKVTVKIWLEAADYVVVLSKREGYVLPWTAYFIEHEHRRKKLRREFEAAQKESKA
jgi:hypothetical protein